MANVGYLFPVKLAENMQRRSGRICDPWLRYHAPDLCLFDCYFMFIALFITYRRTLGTLNEII